MAIVSEILLKDRYTSTAKKVEGSISSLTKSSKAMDKVFGKTHELKIKDIKSKKARKDLQALNSDLRKISGKKYSVSIEAKTPRTSLKSNMASLVGGLKGKAVKIKTDFSALRKAKSEAKSLSRYLTSTTGKKHKIKISLDKSGLDGIKAKLSGLKGGLLGMGGGAGTILKAAGLTGLAGIVGGAGIGAGAAAGVASMVRGASDLEQQKISMTHFLGGDKKASEAYIKTLRENANATPFGTNEVIAAGTRAVQISGGDVKKGMEYVRLAEDMAALNPGKSISDAMEALADAIQKIIPFWRLIFSCFIEVSPIL